MTNLNRLEMKTEDDIQKILPQMNLPSHVEEDILALVERLNDFLSQDGYELIFRRSLAGNIRTILNNSADLNIIPGNEAGICCPLAVAFCRGESNYSPYGFRNVLRAVRKHMIYCFNDTSTVMFITDVWSPRLLEESRGDLAAYKARGKHILFFLVNGRKLTLLRWN